MKNKKFPFLKLCICLLVIGIIFVLVFVGLDIYNSYRLNTLVSNASKKYFDEQGMPDQAGQCFSVNISDLINNNFLNADTFSNCGKTVSKVCNTGSGFDYAVVLACNEEINFGNWQDEKPKGDYDIQVVYKGYVLAGGEKKYLNENEYYLETLDLNYPYFDEGVTGYKWYVPEYIEVYYNNNEYTAIQPEGFENKGLESTVISYTIELPEEKEGRIIENIKLYKKDSKPYPYSYLCESEITSSMTVFSNYSCENREDEYKKTKETYYTCDGLETTSISSLCSTDEIWSLDDCSNLGSDFCLESDGYKVTDVAWQWYKLNEEKYYYPTMSNDVDSVNTYYIDAPVENALKDENTASTVYKFYDYLNNDEYKWASLHTSYVSQEKLLKSFNAKDFNVLSLKAISENDNIKYEYKIQYREVLD